MTGIQPGSYLSIAALRSVRPGREVSLLARVLRTWEAGAFRMCLLGDDTGLIRLRLAQDGVEEGRAYVFGRVRVLRFTGGWQSLQATPNSEMVPSDEPVRVAADDAYISRVYKILTGLEKKRATLGADLY